MKFKFMPILAGVLSAVAIAVTPLVAVAQDQATESEESRPRIVLDAGQQAQFEQIQEDAIAQIQGVLNAEQKEQFTAGLDNGQGLGAVEDLTESQMKEIQGILQAFNTRIGEILTDAQKQEIEESLQNQQ